MKCRKGFSLRMKMLSFSLLSMNLSIAWEWKCSTGPKLKLNIEGIK
jgi:hypothetical protein